MATVRLQPCANVAALVLAAAACFSACGGTAEKPRHGVVLIVLDTLRADHLTPYGYSRETSPMLERLAERSVVFEQAISSSPWTLPSFVALLSTRHPSRESFDQVLLGSLVETIAAAGIQTAAFTEGGYASRVYGFDLGFDSYEQQHPLELSLGGETIRAAEDSSPAETFGQARPWLAAHGKEPFVASRAWAQPQVRPAQEPPFRGRRSHPFRPSRPRVPS
jgi:arylsulfatase A-like enzyme